MNETLKIAVETYADLKGVSFNEIANLIIDGDEKTFEHVTRLMIAARMS